MNQLLNRGALHHFIRQQRKFCYPARFIAFTADSLTLHTWPHRRSPQSRCTRDPPLSASVSPSHEIVKFSMESFRVLAVMHMCATATHKKIFAH